MVETSLQPTPPSAGARAAWPLDAARERPRHDELRRWIAGDLAALRAELASLPGEGSLARLGARYQLDLGGKLLRPTCVVVAAKLGRGSGPEAIHLAVAAELIHNATLLHDDVIDLGERRRGEATARLVWGNAASVLAGDWLLVEALRRVRRSADPELLESALATIEEMIEAEALELENRGRLNLERGDYFRVVEGKTAALFRWAMTAGATVGGLAPRQRASLAEYGEHLGVAFQLVDDLLDVAGDPQLTGKTTFADLREGKMTYPLLLLLERDAELRFEVERYLRRETSEPPPLALREGLRLRLETSGSLEECREAARGHADEAVACLTAFPPGPARAALAALAAAAVDRER